MKKGKGGREEETNKESTQQKIPGSVKKWKVPGKKCITTVSKENFERKVTTTMVEFHPQSPQQLVDRYEHMDSRNERWTIILKGIQVEYYSIGNQKS